MRADYIDSARRRIPRGRAQRQDRNGYPAIEARAPSRRRLLPPVTDLLRTHPSEDGLPFDQRVYFRLVSGPNLTQAPRP